MTLAGFRRRLLQNAIDLEHPLRSLARWPAWLLAVASRRPPIARFATGALRMRLIPRLHSFGSTSIYIKRDGYEPELRAIRRLIAPGSVALDIGGSFGIFALFMAEYVGAGGRVHSFEPGRLSFAQLTANLALNPQGARVVAHNAAATDVPGTLRLYHIGGSPVNFSLGASEGIEAEEVPAVRIDAALPAEDAARVSFVKIDVEGSEQAALEGMRPILAAARPTILFEVSADALARQRQAPGDIYAYLAAYGYGFWILDPRGRFVRASGTPEGNIFASAGDLSLLAA